MHTDPISDFLTRLRNALLAKQESILSPSSRMKFVIAKILEKEGFVGSVTEKLDGVKRVLAIDLKYDNAEPAMRVVKRVSTPGRRIYRNAKNLPVVLSDRGIAIVSTSQGVMTNKEARKRKLGGEIICEIY
jgi:small subunit ribosomal protein S8